MDLIHGSSATTIFIALVVAAVVIGVLWTIAAEYASAVCRYDLLVEVRRLRVEQETRLAASAEAREEDADQKRPHVRPFKTLPSIVSVEAPTVTEVAVKDSGSALPTRSLLAVH